mgnify:CR=1 FL=1
MMKPIIVEVNKIIYKIFKRQHPILAELIVNWSKVVGVKFSSNSMPLKIVSSREKGAKINILYIQAENSSVSMEMSYQQELIIERIAIYLGYKGIHKIRMSARG